MPLTPQRNPTTGQVIPHDHPEIKNTDGIIRRISEEQLVFDEKIGRKRISTKAFQASSGPNEGMSVDLQVQIEEAGLDARVYVTTPKWIGSVRLEAGTLRERNLKVGFRPTRNNPYHGEVWGAFPKSTQRYLLNNCVWFVEIPGVSIL